MHTIRELSLVVETALNAGGSLSIFPIIAGRLQRIARTPFIGIPNRWLNPAELGDFDGDGRNEITLVKTPHIGGTLEIWELKGSDETGWNLVMEGFQHGLSNHGYGSPIQDMSEPADWNRDGITDLVLPGASRRSICIMTFAGGSWNELENIKLPGMIVTEILSLPQSDGSTLMIPGLDTNQLLVIRPN